MKKLSLLCAFTLLAFSLFLTGCAPQNKGLFSFTTQEKLTLDMVSTPTLTLTNRVVRGDQVVSVHPNMNLDKAPTALFVPLGITQQTANPEALSQGISRIIWQQFLSEQSFAALEYAQSRPPYRVEDAISYAKQKNADFLVGGYITYFFEGGSTASTRLSLQIEIYDTSNGNLLWSIAHAGEMPYETTRDYIVMQVETAMPYDPAYVVATALGNDIARLIKLWTTP